MLVVKALAIWLVMLICAVLNGALREFVLLVLVMLLAPLIAARLGRPKSLRRPT
jgi:hypothetical protein